MKHIKYIVILIPLILSLTVNAKINIKPKTDKEIYKLMVGSWVVDPIDPTYNNSGGAISTYHLDGRVSFEQFKDIACKVPFFSTKAKWNISNKKLLIKVLSSTRPDLHPAGLIVADKVININNKSAVLKPTRGKLQYRIRSNKCIVKNEI